MYVYTQYNSRLYDVRLIWYESPQDLPLVTIALVLVKTLEHNNLLCQPYTPYSARMSPKNTHKLMGFCMEVLILGVVHGFCSFKLVPIGLKLVLWYKEWIRHPSRANPSPSPVHR